MWCKGRGLLCLKKNIYLLKNIITALHCIKLEPRWEGRKQDHRVAEQDHQSQAPGLSSQIIQRTNMTSEGKNSEKDLLREPPLRYLGMEIMLEYNSCKAFWKKSHWCHSYLHVSFTLALMFGRYKFRTYSNSYIWPS